MPSILASLPLEDLVIQCQTDTGLQRMRYQDERHSLAEAWVAKCPTLRFVHFPDFIISYSDELRSSWASITIDECEEIKSKILDAHASRLESTD